MEENSGILVDIGGASTEVVVFDDGSIVKKASLPMGSLMFHSRSSKDILPSSEECGEMREEAERLLASAMDFREVSRPKLCGIGGTFKGAMALYNMVFSMDSANRTMKIGEIREIIHRFQRDRKLGTREIAFLMKTVPERMHTLLPGRVIADVLAGRFGSDTILYSDSGVREGYIYKKIIGR